MYVYPTFELDHAVPSPPDKRPAAIKALRARDAARGKCPRAVRVDRRQVRAPRERVEQVRERGRVETQEVDRCERAGAERTEASIYSPLTKMV